MFLIVTKFILFKRFVTKYIVSESSWYGSSSPIISTIFNARKAFWSFSINFNKLFGTSNFFISSSYLPSPVERLKVYRKLDEAESFETIIKIKDDLIDRCGVMPDETKNLIEDKKIQIRVYKSGIKSIKSNNTNTNFHLSDTLNDNTLENLLSLVTKDRKKYLINKESKFIYKYNESDSKKRRKNVNLLLDEIL